MSPVQCDKQPMWWMYDVQGLQFVGLWRITSDAHQLGFGQRRLAVSRRPSLSRRTEIRISVMVST